MKTVLLIEDDTLLVPLYTLLLEKTGMMVLHSVKAGEVRRMIEKKEIDLVLLDVMLPEVSGLEILPAIQRLRPKLPVVMLSNLHQPDLRKFAYDMGARGYLIKSEHTPDTFVTAVKEFLALPG